MFLFAFAASCAPCQADALNHLSSTPPVSSARHAFVALAAVAAGAAPNASAAAAKTATNLIVFFKVFLQGINGYFVALSLVVSAENQQKARVNFGVWLVTIEKTLKLNFKARRGFSPLWLPRY